MDCVARQEGTSENDNLYGVAVDQDGSAVFTGLSAGEWDGVSSGDQDFVAVKIDRNGEELWRWQV